MDSDSQEGGAKKFLYSGPKKDADDQDDLPWNFNAKPANKGTGISNSNSGSFGVDDVWSIKRNVNLKGGVKEVKPEPLTYNANKSYYSRYGDATKEKDEFGTSLNATGASNSQADSKSWGASSQARRPFSYAYNSESTTEQPVSPRNVSNSSAAVYPQSGNIQQANRNTNNFSNSGSGNINSFSQQGGASSSNFDQSSSGNINSFGQSGHSGSRFGQSGNSNNIFNPSSGSGSIILSQSGNSNMNNTNQLNHSVSNGPSWRATLQNQGGPSNVNTGSSLAGTVGKGERIGGNSLFNKPTSTNFTGGSHPRTKNSLFTSSQPSSTSRHSSSFQSNNKKSEFESDSQDKSLW